VTSNPKSELLAIHSGALGDVVLFGRLLERLGGNVALVAGGEKARLLAGLGVVARAIDFDALPMHELFADTPLEQCRLPALLGRCGRMVSCFATGNAAAEQRLTEACGTSDATFLPIRPPAEHAGHLLDLWSTRMGLGGDFARPRAWPVPDTWRQEAAELLRKAGGEPDAPYVVLHPGAGAVDKCWPVERFLELAKLVQDSTACKQAVAPGVCFVLGPIERERWPDGDVEVLRRTFPTLICPPLAALAGVLAGAAGFIGNDSGVSHLAGAVGAPTVAMFGPTRAEHFAPVGPRVRTIARGSLPDIDAAEALAALSALSR